MEARDAKAATGAPRRMDPARPLVAARPRYGEKVIQALLAACALISVITTTVIVISLLSPTLNFFEEVGFGKFFSLDEWAPTQAEPTFGALRLVIGTLSATLWALLFAVPIGLLSAIYLSEYAHPRVRKTVKPVLEVLAGIPTVALGLFAITFISPEIQGIFPNAVKSPPFFVLAAGLGIGLLIVPIIASLSDDAMRAVPGGLREGAYGLGADRLKVSTKVVFPAAISGIVASIVLAASRAIGETMIVLLAAGQQPNLSFDPREAVETMSAFIAATGAGDVPTGSTEYKTIFAVGATLFVMTLILNFFSIRLVRKYREVYE